MPKQRRKSEADGSKSGAIVPSTADAPPTDILKVDVLKPEIQASSAQAPAPAVTPTDTPATPPAPRHSSPAVSGVAFAIQIASLKDPEKARSLMNKFREIGYPAFCQSSEINTTTWHRVRIGPYPDRAMADKDYNRLKAAGVDALIISME
ncbi:MAG: SPOR domain-containing protein [Desulfobacterales bacterium]